MGTDGDMDGDRDRGMGSDSEYGRMRVGGGLRGDWGILGRIGGRAGEDWRRTEE